MRVPILVRGKDSRGSPFVVNAFTHDITATGASVNGLKGVADLGSKIEIEYQGGKAWYRIQWIGKVGTPRAGHAGVKCLETGNYIWGVPLPEWKADTYDSARGHAAAATPPPVSYHSPAPAATRAEQRKYPRTACRIEATVTDEKSLMPFSAKLTDISLGGCYLEMLSPMPLGSLVELALNSDEGPLHARGKVAVSQAGMGMGVAFTAISPDHFEILRKLAPTAPHENGNEVAAVIPSSTAPAVPSNGSRAANYSSHAVPTTQEALEAVLRVLVRKGIVNEHELAEEFEKLIVSKN